MAGWTISEGAGVRKPDRRIFELAAAAPGVTGPTGATTLRQVIGR